MKSPDQPLDRALAILGTVAGAGAALSVTEIAQRCALPLPTVHRMVAQLEQRALLKRLVGSRRLLVGPGLVKLGAAAVEVVTSAVESRVPGASESQYSKRTRAGRVVWTQSSTSRISE